MDTNKVATTWIEGVTVPLLVANQPTKNHNVYTEDCLRSAAKLSPDYVYDEATKTLYFRLHAQEEPQDQRKMEVPAQPTSAPLTPKQQWYVDNRRAELSNDTNAEFQNVMVPYTKVWAFLRTIIQDSTLRASTLLEALQLASKVSNDEVVQLSDYNESSKTAHHLMATYFLNK